MRGFFLFAAFLVSVVAMILLGSGVSLSIKLTIPDGDVSRALLLVGFLLTTVLTANQLLRGSDAP